MRGDAGRFQEPVSYCTPKAQVWLSQLHHETAGELALKLEGFVVGGLGGPGAFFNSSPARTCPLMAHQLRSSLLAKP